MKTGEWLSENGLDTLELNQRLSAQGICAHVLCTLTTQLNERPLGVLYL